MRLDHIWGTPAWAGGCSGLTDTSVRPPTLLPEAAPYLTEASVPQALAFVLGGRYVLPVLCVSAR